MLRKQFSKIFKSDRLRKRVFSVLTLICLLGYLWIICIGDMATNFHVNDLGLKGYVKTPLPFSPNTLNFLYRNIEEKHKKLAIDQKFDNLVNLLKNELKTETYVFPFKDQESGYEDKNIVSYLRSQKGMGNQCNLLAFPMTDSESLKVGVGFIHHWKETNIFFQHKDIILLFYSPSSYSLATKEFLNQYLDKNNAIRGRCGTIRHAFTIYEFKHHSKTVSFVSEGRNYNNNDQNLHYVAKHAFKVNKLKVDVNYPYSYSKNTFWKKTVKEPLTKNKEINKFLSQLSDTLYKNIVVSFFELLKQFDVKMSHENLSKS